MRARQPSTIAVTILAYIVCTFGVQGASHFAINAAHYASVTIMRPEPVIAMGVGSMLVQGTLFAFLFPRFDRDGRTMRNALAFSWSLGAFLASYIVLAEAGKYAIPSIPSWITVEAGAAAVQYTLFGLLLGLIHRQSAPAAASTGA